MNDWVKEHVAALVMVVFAAMGVVYGYGQLTDHIGIVDEGIQGNSVKLDGLSADIHILDKEVAINGVEIRKLEQDVKDLSSQLDAMKQVRDASP